MYMTIASVTYASSFMTCASLREPLGLQLSDDLVRDDSKERDRKELLSNICAMSSFHNTKNK